MGGKKYPFYTKKISVDPDSGADIITYSQTSEVLAFIQSTGTSGDVKGIVLSDNKSGDVITADFFMFAEKKLDEHNRVKYRDLMYEIRAVEPWESSFMNFWKFYLVKVDK